MIECIPKFTHMMWDLMSLLLAVMGIIFSDIN